MRRNRGGGWYLEEGNDQDTEHKGPNPACVRFVQLSLALGRVRAREGKGKRRGGRKRLTRKTLRSTVKGLRGGNSRTYFFMSLAVCMPSLLLQRMSTLTPLTWSNFTMGIFAPLTTSM
jgi:hypothetical protein